MNTTIENISGIVFGISLYPMLILATLLVFPALMVILMALADCNTIGEAIKEVYVDMPMNFIKNNI